MPAASIRAIIPDYGGNPGDSHLQTRRPENLTSNIKRRNELYSAIG
jgi:hypothetical protein